MVIRFEKVGGILLSSLFLRNFSKFFIKIYFTGWVDCSFLHELSSSGSKWEQCTDFLCCRARPGLWGAMASVAGVPGVVVAALGPRAQAQ